MTYSDNGQTQNKKKPDAFNKVKVVLRKIGENNILKTVNTIKLIGMGDKHKLRQENWRKPIMFGPNNTVLIALL